MASWRVTIKKKFMDEETFVVVASAIVAAANKAQVVLEATKEDHREYDILKLEKWNLG